jgi:hypothetical protein
VTKGGHIVRRLIGVLLLALAAGTLVPAASAVAGANPAKPGLQRFGVRLVDVPVSDAHNPRGLRYIIDYLPAGAVIHRRILIMNQEKTKSHFTVYPDAAQITRGRFIGDAGHTRSELTTWVSIAHPFVTLRPHASVMDMVTIRVPRNPTRAEHYGVIWVQQVANARSARGFAIKEVSRVGIRIYLAVGRGGVPPTSFTITSIAGHRSPRGQAILTALARNTGGRAVDLYGTARLTGGPGGTSAGPFPVHQVITVAPGQADTVTFLPGRRLPSGPWRAAVTLISGFTRRTASATILFSPHLASSLWTRPSTMVWGVVGIAALVLLILIPVRRARQARRVAA